jgi:hypothetical protein
MFSYSCERGERGERGEREREREGERERGEREREVKLYLNRCKFMFFNESDFCMKFISGNLLKLYFNL